MSRRAVERLMPPTNETTLPPDVVEMFREMGLSRTEVDVYKFLLRRGPAVPSAIARETGQHRGRIYENMRNLVGKGFVREEPTRPIRFVAMPLPEILQAAKSRLLRHLEIVGRGQERWTQATPLVPEPVAPPLRIRDVRVLSGRRSCFAEIMRAAARSQRFFRIVGGFGFADRLANMPRLQETLRGCAARGVELAVILPAFERPTPAAMALQAELGAWTRHLRRLEELGPVTLCASESTYMEVVAQPDDAAPHRGEDVGFQLTNPVYLEAARRRFDWAEAYFQAVPALAKPPGTAAPANRTAAFERALLRARKEVVMCYVGAGGAEPDWAVAEAIGRSAKARGVRLRALVLGRPGAPPPASETWDIRTANLIPGPLAVIDGQFLLHPGQGAANGQSSRWQESKDPAAAQLHQRMFEQLWLKADPEAAMKPIEAVPAASRTDSTAWRTGSTPT